MVFFEAIPLIFSLTINNFIQYFMLKKKNSLTLGNVDSQIFLNATAFNS